MIFAEKLAFLMQLTSTSNKQLAEAVKVDPSLISRFRGARRSAPKNLVYTKAMAAYFAKKCEGNYQRLALSEALGRKQLQMQMGTDTLAAILFDWLTDSRDQVGQFLSTFERFTLEHPEGAGGLSEGRSAEMEDTGSYAYFGNEGKRGAVGAFVDCLASLEEPGVILVSSDESTEWLFEDRLYLSRLQEKLLALLSRGFRLCRIAPSLTTADQAFDSLSCWLPLYMTGQVESYSYPRLRDELYRRTLIVLPEQAAIVSTSSAAQRGSRATVYTRDKRLAAAYAGEFHDLLARCVPVMTTHSAEGDADELLRLIAQFESDRGDRIQQSCTLSAVTAPEELVRLSAEGAPEREAGAIIGSLTEARDMFRQSLREYKMVDIHSVAEAEEVRAGHVPMATAYLRRENVRCHTPETYALHLASILEHVERYENYTAVLLPRGPGTHSLMVKDGRQAMLLRPGPPLTVFEVSQPNIAEACREYLLRRAESPLSPAARRQETLSVLRRRIHELTGR